MPDLRRIRCRTAYDGTNFHGWQVQPGLPTVQAELQRVISEIEESPVVVEASGRTDAGVHALRQMIAFSIQNRIPCDNLRRAINRLLPHTIRVFEVEETNAEFHPRFDAVSKHYQYRIWREEICPPFDRPYVHHHPYPLDETIMAEAAEALVGEHDFTAFAAADEKDALGHSKVRQIFKSSLHRDGPRLYYDVEGSGFLKHMVRNLIGAIVETGKGNLTTGEFKALLAGLGKANPTLPAQGLFLIDVHYR